MKKLFAPLVERWHRFYHRSSIQLILSMSFTAVSVVGMISLGLTLFIRFYASANEQVAQANQRVLNQVNLNVSTYLSQMMDVSDTLYYVGVKNINLLEDTVDDALGLLYESNRDNIVSIALFTQTGQLVTSTPYATLKEEVEPGEQEWFVSALERTENLHFSTPLVQNLFVDADYQYNWVVSLSRYVELTWGGVTQGGVLLVDMSYSGIEQICKEVDLADDGYLYLMDQDGTLIYHPRQQLIYANLAEENNLQAATYEDGTHQEEFLGESRQVVVKTVGYTGWKLVAVTPVSYLGSNSGDLILFFLFVVLFSVFLLIFVNMHLSERISGPIKELDRAINAVEKGAQELDIAVSGPHEIERLSHSIRSMVSTLHHLMEDIIQQEQEKRRSDLDVLHSQINPHFLYNTLDSVIRMVEMERNDEAVVMVTSLARLFRISLSQGHNIIPITAELDHARHYLTIQKMRYKDKFSATIHMDEALKSLYTTKLIVQPILENAIYHGMAYADDDGIIAIRCYLEGDCVVIDVEDNGPGMPEETVAKLLDGRYKGPHTKGSGIGLQNVHQRIGLTFGKAYGLEIFSEPDAGTKVQIRLPVVTQETAQGYWKEELS